MSDDTELADARHADNCCCEYDGQPGIVEYLYRGRGRRREAIRAKVILESGRVLHVDFLELRIW